MLRLIKETNLELVLVRDRLSPSVVDIHRTLSQPVIFLEFGVHEEYGFARLGRTFFQCLFEQISGALQFRAALRFGENVRMNIASSECKYGYSHIVW